MKKLVGNLILKASGWKALPGEPDAQSYVIIAAPHTSNWDLVYMLAIGFVLDIDIRWMGKKSLFEPPLGWLTGPLGGVPIDRSQPQGVVEQMARRLQGEPMKLAVPPSGTRSRREYWKSGFYHIANAAQVPIALGFLDYSRKEGGLGPSVTPTGDIVADMDKIRAFYASKRGKFPQQETRIRLKEEDALEASAAAAAEVGDTKAEATAT